jgi:hypothetical protein
MKYLLKGTMVLGMAVCFAAAAFAIHEIIPSETMVALPGPDAEKLNDYIIKYNPYRSWSLWPGKGRLYKGPKPHGELLTTFVNDAALVAIRKRATMKDGAIIVKENYSADKEFKALTVMYKIKGYNPRAGDWFWAKYAPDGSVQASGKVEGCINCHGARRDNDFVFTGEVGKY